MLGTAPCPPNEGRELGIPTTDADTEAVNREKCAEKCRGDTTHRPCSVKQRGRTDRPSSNTCTRYLVRSCLVGLEQRHKFPFSAMECRVAAYSRVTGNQTGSVCFLHLRVPRTHREKKGLGKAKRKVSTGDDGPLRPRSDEDFSTVLATSKLRAPRSRWPRCQEAGPEQSSR